MAKLYGQTCGDFSPMNTYPVTLMPIKDHLSTQAHQTGLRNKPQENQTSEPLAMIHTWVVSSLSRKIITC